jgi:hypothetical protein
MGDLLGDRPKGIAVANRAMQGFPGGRFYYDLRQKQSETVS